jgi:putative MATE family efflux protein
MEERTRLLGEEKIGRLLLKLSLPAGVAMVVMALYNIVDAIFVGRGVGTLGIAGIAVVLPIQLIITAAAQTIGVGGSSIISRDLGAGNTERANQTLGNMVTLIVILSTILVGLGYLFRTSILQLFGANQEIMVYASDYYSIILAGTFFLNFCMTANNVIRAEGNAKVAMVSMLVSAVVNIILDPIFIFGFNMGIKGAAWATVIAQLVNLIFIVYYFAGNWTGFKLHKKHLRLEKPIVKETFSVGGASFARQAAGSLMATVMNHSLLIHGGETAVAVYGLLNRLLAFIFLPMVGLTQGFMPIVGYNFGANNVQRVRQVLRLSNISATLMATGGFILIQLFAREMIWIFSDDPILLEQGEHALRLVMLGLPLIGMQIIGSGYFQALGKSLPSFFLSLSRPFLFLIPFVVLLPTLWGLNGIWIAFPIADTISAIVTFFMMAPEVKALENLQVQQELVK